MGHSGMTFQVTYYILDQITRISVSGLNKEFQQLLCGGGGGEVIQTTVCGSLSVVLESQNMKF